MISQSFSRAASLSVVRVDSYGWVTFDSNGNR
jgi:hypothetical protein